MPDQEKEARTEPATPRRRQEARERGQVARSQDLASALVLFGVVLFMRLYGERLLWGLAGAARAILGLMSEPPLEPGAMRVFVLSLAGELARLVVPAMLFFLAASLAANWLQFGFVLSGTPLAPNLAKLNPVNGARRLLSLRALALAAAGVLKVAAVALVVWLNLRRALPASGVLAEADPRAILYLAAGFTWRLTLEVALALLAIAILDYLFQRWQYEQDLRMTREEVREELKRMEGDPTIRSRRRQIHRQIAYQRMMAAVPEAEVVITNPTELAVALAYDGARDAAPVVVAKGARKLAEKIRHLAREHGVPVVENKPLARALWRGVEVGEAIPEALYEAVAEVLAYVWRLARLRDAQRSGAEGRAA